ERLAQGARYRAAELLDAGGNERRGAADAHVRAQLAQAMDVGPRDAAVRDVAHDGHDLALERAPALAQAQRIEQTLRRVLMGAVAGIDHARPHRSGDESRRAGSRVAYHQRIGADGIEIAHGVLERLPFGDARGVLLEGEDVRAESFRRHLEGAAGARAGLEEEG